MRRILLGFLTLIMFTPSLACAMTYCPVPVRDAEKPCHQPGDSKKDGPMLTLDCMGIDLFQKDAQTDTPQPDQSIDTIHFVWVDLATDYSFYHTNTHGIRGPPDWGERAPNQPSLILTTQRFRI